MVNVYPKEYLDKFEVKEESFKDMKERNRVARELRKEGWTVECKTWRFPDLGGGALYKLNATRPRE